MSEIERMHDELDREFAAIRANAKRRRVQYVFASEIDPEPIDWLWDGYLAHGKITLIGGNPDVGKTLMVLDWIARVTNEKHWPHGARAPLGSAFILSAEDGAADTIRPRLEAAGANLGLVGILKSVTNGAGEYKTFSLQSDLEQLGNAMAQAQARARLLLIDPITAYLGSDIDSNRTTDVRAALEPLSKFAEEQQIAVVAITHPPKGASGNAINSFTGSLAFVAAPRLAFIVTNEADSDRKLLLKVKNNIGVGAGGRAYRILTKEITYGIIAPCIAWDDAPVDVTASEALYEQSQAAKGSTNAREKAKALIEEQLADGPKPAADIEAAAREKGISERTLKRAKSEVGVVSQKDGYQGAWTWALPSVEGDQD